MKVARAREKDVLKGGFCPLNLVSGDMSRVADVVEALMGGWNYSDMERMRVGDRLMSWARESGEGLLGRLRELQGRLDGKGVLEADVTSGEFETAMTLRDCTLFLKVCCISPSNHPQEIMGLQSLFVMREGALNKLIRHYLDPTVLPRRRRSPPGRSRSQIRQRRESRLLAEYRATTNRRRLVYLYRSRK